jgi:hypothetical protein
MIREELLVLSMIETAIKLSKEERTKEEKLADMKAIVEDMKTMYSVSEKRLKSAKMNYQILSNKKAIPNFETEEEAVIGFIFQVSSQRSPYHLFLAFIRMASTFGYEPIGLLNYFK